MNDSFLQEQGVSGALIESVRKFRESGTEIITPSEELYNEIRELCKPIYASIENSVSQEIIDAYLGDMQEELQ